MDDLSGGPARPDIGTGLSGLPGFLLGMYRRLPVRWREPVSRLYWRVRLRKARLPRLPRSVGTHWPAFPPTPVRSKAYGVRVFGYFGGQFGLGESARLYATALMSAGVPVEIHDVNLDLPHERREFAFEGGSLAGIERVVDLVIVNPDHLERALPALPDLASRGSLTVGCWFWELASIPADWQWALSRFDAFLAASDFIGEALREVTRAPIVVVPLPVLPRSTSGLLRTDVGLPENAFVFLCSFDFHSSVARKNPEAAIRAFQRAFPTRREEAFLLIKSNNGKFYPQQLLHLLHLARLDGRIRLMDGVIDPAHMRAIQCMCDVSVSLHRAEGFGLGMAECMALGKPVIATGWSGNLEFMDDHTAFLVRHSAVAVRPGEYAGAEGAIWAEPDVAHAASLMREAYDDRVRARALGERGAARVRSELDVVAIGDRLVGVFDDLLGADSGCQRSATV